MELLKVGKTDRLPGSKEFKRGTRFFFSECLLQIRRSKLFTGWNLQTGYFFLMAINSSFQWVDIKNIFRKHFFFTFNKLNL